MKLKTFSLLIFLLASFYSQAQSAYSIGFTYDASGNRVLRKVILFGIGREANTEVKKDSLAGSLISIYPNPATSQLNIKITNNDLPKSISLYDFFGRMLLTRENLPETYSLDVSPYAAGTYLLKLKIGEKETIWKIVKEE